MQATERMARSRSSRQGDRRVVTNRSVRLFDAINGTVPVSRASQEQFEATTASIPRECTGREKIYTGTLGVAHFSV